jgi:hypothetical protein
MTCPKPIDVVVAQVHRAARRRNVQRILRNARVEPEDVAQDVFVRELLRQRSGKPSALLDGGANAKLANVLTKWRAVDATRHIHNRLEEQFPAVVECGEVGAWDPFDAVDEVTPSPHEVLEERRARAQAEAVVAKIHERARAVDADPSAQPRVRRRMGLVVGALAGISLSALAATAQMDTASAHRSIHNTVARAVAGELGNAQ